MLKDNFEIAYKVEGKEDDYVIPMLLPDIPLDYEFNNKNGITLIIKFGFMPYGVFSRLVVQLNNYIDFQNLNGIEKQIVWKKGMLLKSSNDTFAEVIESDDKEQTPKEIKVKVGGKNIIEKKRFLNQIVSQIYQINTNWFNDNLKFDEFIPCTCKVCIEIEKDEDKQFYKSKYLENLLRVGEKKVICEKSTESENLQKVYIRKLLDGVYLETKEKSDNTFNFYNKTQFVNDANTGVLIEQNIWDEQEED